MPILTTPPASALWPPATGGHAGLPRDPYLRWAELSDWRNLKPGGRQLPAQLSFVVERSAASANWNDVRSSPFGVSVPPAYDQPLPAIGAAAGGPSHFATLRIATSLPGAPGSTLPSAAIAARIASVLANPKVARLQLGYPRGAAVEAVSRPLPPVPVPEPADVVLGIIDYGCPFAHSQLLDMHGAPRVAVLWQQSTRDPADAPWQAPSGFAHGRVLDRPAMAALMAASTRAGRVDELLCYENAFAVLDREPEDPLSPPRRQWLKPSRVLLARASHGSGVLAMAAAPAAALTTHVAPGLPVAEQPVYALYAPPGDAASVCPLIMVDLPREQSEVSSGRWLPVNALDGMRFILTEARKRFVVSPAAAEPVPVVINLSSGAHAGAHAGQAMFERAMDELLLADERLAITLAAGNSRRIDTHAELTVPPAAAGLPGRAELGLSVPPAQAFDTCVEFWLPPGTDLRTLAFEVQAPGGPVLRVDGAQAEDEWRIGTDQLMAALLLYPVVAQATDRSMALLCIWGTTSSRTRRSPAPAGPWHITVSNRAAQPLAVSAWIENDEVIFGRVRTQVARFFNPARCGPGEEPAQVAARVVRRDDTLSNIATATQALAVAAYQGRRDQGPVSRYSGMPRLGAAAAPGAPAPPLAWLPLAAAADAGLSHPGVRVAGNRGAALQRFNGTSAAAPQAARYLANAMAAGATRPAIVAGLPATPVALPAPPDWLQHPAEPAPPTGTPFSHPADGRLRLP
ncbi:hypothetical protein [Aquabacterium sp. OR-4]|uniref:hypothetical protein n=1 Tax=Aquabacterium sp. OR-4 TaxID=2978127 RepID=UPI0021B40CCB|nr:hypothetical protein [Aquabacterium sp. OR-4]MDT7833689.1 hypothetical protein [Aquabacterium sp. OR-4]